MQVGKQLAGHSIHGDEALEVQSRSQGLLSNVLQGSQIQGWPVEGGAAFLQGSLWHAAQLIHLAGAERAVSQEEVPQ